MSPCRFSCAATLKGFLARTHTDLDKKLEIYSVDDDNTDVSVDQFILLIPRSCLVETLDVSTEMINMDVVDMGEWICKDLKILRVGVGGLDTKSKILDAVALWHKRFWRRRQEKAEALVAMEEQSEIDLSIEARIARHLNIDKLESVWLGCQL